jgi:hypothetical protein
MKRLLGASGKCLNAIFLFSAIETQAIAKTFHLRAHKKKRREKQFSLVSRKTVSLERH